MSMEEPKLAKVTLHEFIHELGGLGKNILKTRERRLFP
jgi:hypothetical protein